MKHHGIYRLVLCINVIISCVPVSCQKSVWSDEHVLRALGDHGDRIADLEKLVKTLSSDRTNLQQEVASLRAETLELKHDLTNITDNCVRAITCTSDRLSTHHANNATHDANNATHDANNVTHHANNVTHDVNNVTHDANNATHHANNATHHASNATHHVNNVTHDANNVTHHANNATHHANNATHHVNNVTHDANNATTTSTDSMAYTHTTTHRAATRVPLHSTTSSTIAITPPTTSTAATHSYQNCHDAIADRRQSSGIYDIRLGSAGSVIPVYCEIQNGDTWLVIQRRQSGSVHFNRTWAGYKHGFGQLNGEFWLGNENIHKLTSSDSYTLRLDMHDWGGNQVYAEYAHFNVDAEWKKYTLNVGSYRGTAGDSFHYAGSYLLKHHSMPFSTPDLDQDLSFMNCADRLQSGWWFNSCYSSNLNGAYLPHPYGHRLLGESTGDPTLEGTGIEWYPYRHRQYSMRRVEMKIKLSGHNTQLFG